MKGHFVGFDIAEFGHLLDGAGRGEAVGLLKAVIESGVVQDLVAVGGRKCGQPVGDEVKNIAVVTGALGVAGGAGIEDGYEDCADKLVHSS